MKIDNSLALYVVENAWSHATDYYTKEGLKLAQRAVEDKMRYAWHDLRKNPDDLPGNYDEVVCFVNHEYRLFRYHDDEDWTWEVVGHDGSYISNVIAWRYIEPFEEDE